MGAAMALALSWKPFVKSKINATKITVTTTNSTVTRVPIWNGSCDAPVNTG